MLASTPPRPGELPSLVSLSNLLGIALSLPPCEACTKPGTVQPHMPGSDVAEELSVHRDVFDLADCGLEAEVVLLQQVTEPVAIDEVYRWSAVSCGLCLRTRGAITSV